MIGIKRKRRVQTSVRFVFILLVLIVAFLLVHGCGSLLGEAPPQRTYLLDVQIAQSPISQPSNHVLLVAESRAEAGFDTPRMAYSRKVAELEYYTESSWVDTPTRMLTPLIVRSLEASHAFQAVLTPRP